MDDYHTLTSSISSLNNDAYNSGGALSHISNHGHVSDQHNDNSKGMEIGGPVCVMPTTVSVAAAAVAVAAVAAAANFNV